jgi:hypothetical protein
MEFYLYISRVYLESGYCITPNEIFPSISWLEQVAFNEIMMMSLCSELDFIVLAH